MKKIFWIAFTICSICLLSCKKQETVFPEVKAADTNSMSSQLLRWDQLPDKFKNARKIKMPFADTTLASNRTIRSSYGPYGSVNNGTYFWLNNMFYQIISIGIGTLDGTSVSLLLVWCKVADGEVVLYTSKDPEGSRLVFRSMDYDEYIRGIGGNATTSINSLVIYTNKTMLSLGSGTGPAFSDVPGVGIEFRYFSGYSGISKMSSISFRATLRPWTQLAGSAGKDIAIDPNGNSYLVNGAGKIYTMNANASTWTQLNGSDAVSIAAGLGQVCMVNSAGKIYKLNGTAWNQMPGSSARDITIDASGTIWMVNSAGYIYTFNGTSWVQKPGSAASRIAAGGNVSLNHSVWMVNTSGKIYRWSGSGWTQMTGSAGVDIAVGRDNNVWLTNTAGIIYRYDYPLNDWIQMAGSDGSAIASNANKVVMVNTAGKIYKMTY